MKQPRDFERLLEAYASGDAADHERRLVEGVLRGDDGEAKALAAREALQFEESLSRALNDGLTEPSADEIADSVLARVYRRPTMPSRGQFDPGLARKTLEGALERSPLSVPTDRRRYYFQRPGFLRVAMLLIVFSAMTFFSLRDYRQTQMEKLAIQGASPNTPTLGEVNFVSAKSDGDAMSTAPAMGSKKLVVPSEIKTPRDRVAVVRLGGLGMFVVKPQSQVRLARSRRTGGVVVHIESGGIRAKMNGSHPLHVMAAAGRQGVIDGEVRGESEIVRANDALGKGASLVAPVLDQSILVSVNRGKAVFRNRSNVLHLADGDLGVVGDTTLRKLPRRDPVNAKIPKRRWNLDGVIDRGTETALSIGDKNFSRSFLAREALRVYGDDLVEHITKSRVIQAELGRRRLTIPRANHNVATAFVMSDELMQVMPMRGEFALQERAFQVAGLLTLEGRGNFLHQDSSTVSSVGAICDRVWNRLQPLVRLRWAENVNRQSAFQIDYQGMVINVGLAEAWDVLRRSLRQSEVERMLDDYIERQVIEAWLRDNGESWPDLAWTPASDPVRRGAQNVLVRLNGLTLTQYRDRLRVQSAMLAFVPEPDEADVNRFVVEQMPDRSRVFFEHYFFSFVDRDQGFSYSIGESAKLEAQRVAEHTIDSLRSGQTPQIESPSTPQPQIWQTRWSYGPRPWWDEIYGESFRPAVLALADGEISAPLEGREGYHVVRMRRGVATDVARVQREQIAKHLVKVERARQEIEKLLQRVRTSRRPAEELLR